MDDQKLKKRIVEFLYNFETDMIVPGCITDPKSGKHVPLDRDSRGYRINGKFFWTQDIYNFDKHDYPLPDGVYEWVVEQLQKMTDQELEELDKKSLRNGVLEEYAEDILLPFSGIYND